MDFLQVLGAAITFGSALGATVAGFFAYRQKSLVILLRESNKDYQDRVKQLEDERDSLNVKIEALAQQIKTLQVQQELPLQDLTKLIVDNDTKIIGELTDLANKVASLKTARQRASNTTRRRTP